MHKMTTKWHNFLSCSQSLLQHHKPSAYQVHSFQAFTQRVHNRHRASKHAPHHTSSNTVTITISINLNSPTHKMKFQEISNKGQPQSQPAKAEQPKTESKTNSAVSEKEPARPDQKAPTTPRKRNGTDKCPRCGSTGFLGQCHSCSLGTGVGL
ncbi:hypothetical protein EAE96_001179 [Botrytis aclada]|nr:hypothetical protein EAE96_001179 [Botrytis aclada]